MTVRNTGTPAGFPAVVNLLIVPMMRRAMRKDLARLKQILEGADRHAGRRGLREVRPKGK